MATPCSAPFLGTAIGFSSMTSVINIFLIFNFIALGFSLPYIFLLIHPPLLKIIPNPCRWMENFKFFFRFDFTIYNYLVDEINWNGD